ncbi:MAG: hypothetical protein IJP62_11305 [Treponema sp.]|nr:hypothetical protein [Treponema sp.]
MTIVELNALRSSKENFSDKLKSTEFLLQAAKLTEQISDFFKDDLYTKIFVMYYCALMTDTEISKSLGLQQAKTVKNILESGREKIRRYERRQIEGRVRK